MPDKKEEKSLGFNVNKFIKGNEEHTKHLVNKVVVDQVIDESKEKKKRVSKKNTEVAPAGTINIPMAQNSMSYVQGEIPYSMAYAENNQQLDITLKQLDAIGGGLMLDLENMRSKPALKNKYTYLTNITEVLNSIIGNKISIIKEKNKVIGDINSMEIRRIKDLKLSTSQEDDNTKLQNMYAAFINTPIGNVVPNRNALLGPSMQEMTLYGASDIPVQQMGPTDTNWQQELSPAQNRMLLESQGKIETVVMYDESSGNRWFEVVDKMTGQPVPNVEKPDDSFIYSLNINVNGRFAKDSNLNITYPLVVVNQSNGGSINEY